VLYYYYTWRPVPPRVLDQIARELRAARVAATAATALITASALERLASGWDIKVMNYQFETVMYFTIASALSLTAAFTLATALKVP
jgi:hypothetical protein